MLLQMSSGRGMTHKGGDNRTRCMDMLEGEPEKRHVEGVILMETGQDMQLGEEEVIITILHHELTVLVMSI